MKIAFLPPATVDRRISLQTRVGLVMSGLAACLLVLLGALWLQAARNGVHEEVEAATRVSRQWLQALVGEMRDLPAASREEKLLEVLRNIGRVRANVIEVRQLGSTQLSYVSPPSPYKPGRNAPAWFADLLAPQLMASTLQLGSLQLSLRPDPSRAILDAWDELSALAGWALLLLLVLFIGTRSALQRALRPLEQIMAALDRTGRGRFDTRLPLFAAPELGRLARAFNGMADRLESAVDENVRLETGRELAERMQARLEAERREIARELHDELAQGVTAVRALAGSIAQRTAETPSLYGAAQGIVAVTGSMQQGVRSILQRLQSTQQNDLEGQLASYLEHWRLRHEGIEVYSRLALGSAPLPSAQAQALSRAVQEGLTNVLRHARGVSRVELQIERTSAGCTLLLADNGQVRAGETSGQPGCGLGLNGMRERFGLLGGSLVIERPAGGGFVLRGQLPAPMEEVR